MRGSASVGIIARPGFCKRCRITKAKARRRKPPERQFHYSTPWFGRLRLLKHNIVTLPFNSAACAARLLLVLLRGSVSVPGAFVIPASEPVSRNSGAIHRTLQIRHDPRAFVIPASEPVSSFSGCRIKSGMTIELPKQKRGGTNQKSRSAAAQAARRTMLLFHPLIRPLARLGFCSDSAACAARLLCTALLSYRPPSRYPEIPVRFIAPYRFGTTRRQTRG